jgi:[ribosomal protein S18]-alanine N-acetyltransferase
VTRDAALADLPRLAELHASGFLESWSEESLDKLLASPGVFALVADRDGQIAGFVMAREAAGEAEILTIAVAPEARRAGLGRVLVAAAAARAAQMGATSFFLEVATGNAAARGLYTGLGFAEAGRRKGYYEGSAFEPAQDALILRADLPLRAQVRALGIAGQVD